MASSSKLGKAFHSEGPRHSPVQQGLNRLGPQHAGFQITRGGRPIIQLQTEPFEACPDKTDPSVDSELEVNVFVDDAA